LAGLCLLGAALFPGFSREQTLVFGGKSGWQSLSRTEGITRSTGQFGYESLELASNARLPDGATDFLLDFEEDPIADLTGRYTVTESAALATKGVMGKGAALFSGKGGIKLAGDRSAIFGGTGLLGSFSLEFWLKPAIVENGETIVAWYSSRVVNYDALYQTLGAYFYNNKLVWTSINFFDKYTADGGEIILSSNRNIVPEVWAHHRFSFDETTGLLEYRIDGKLEAAKYITSTGAEGGDIYQPYAGIAADLEICPAYSGAMDDLCVRRAPRQIDYWNDYTRLPAGDRANLYSSAGGRIETQPARFVPGSAFKTLSAVTRIPQETGIQFFVRAGGDIFNWNDSYPPWIPVEPGKSPAQVISGEYFQAAAEFYPDGAGRRSPEIIQLDLVIDQAAPPLPPYMVKAEAFDSAVKLNWRVVSAPPAGGCYVYYGERPGEYLGGLALEGPSPVDVGQENSFILRGLQNGKIYYFAIAAYTGIIGDLSAETSARPLPGKGAP
jgi:hypothetical protein